MAKRKNIKYAVMLDGKRILTCDTEKQANEAKRTFAGQSLGYGMNFEVVKVTA